MFSRLDISATLHLKREGGFKFLHGVYIWIHPRIAKFNCLPRGNLSQKNIFEGNFHEDDKVRMLTLHLALAHDTNLTCASAESMCLRLIQ